ncbi:ATP-binding protein [Variovorax sp. KK3]|uniref:ATP-binding protein n=1 Tax=Variovorax sp. KK3 TaxID=1855728 RepID=UPI00097BBA5D|nr:ATP-binding protein [Variovorax sp. KK3]
MTVPSQIQPNAPVTLDNCDREPIHIPGLVQPHGALFAFDDQGRATHVTSNAAALLGVAVPAPGETVAPSHFGGDPDVDALLDAARDDAEGQPQAGEAHLGGQTFDVIVHRMAEQVIAEFELRPASRDEVGDFALKAHRLMDRLKRQRSIESLLGLAVEAVRDLTGFDRVMAYRFLHDDSGEVVAEARHDALEPFQGRRYPASDIPAQARRLYVINSLRLIADVKAAPVGVVAAGADLPPLDMSHCVLRSVSPIHIEYLRNMGVGASMSISVVVNGKLWGLLACHHRSAIQVPYSIRMACDVLGQVLAANVQSQLAREQARRTDDAAKLRARLIEAVLHAEDSTAALAGLAEPIAQAFGADALLVAEDAKLHVHGNLQPETASRIVRWLGGPTAPKGDLLQTHAVAELAQELASICGPWTGLMALRFDEQSQGYLVLLRREQIETIQWGGRPEKNYVSGPLGPRLTPRGSFDVWKQEVRGTSVPWSDVEQALGRQLLDELARASSTRMNEIHRARTHLFAMLGHDLRDPLQSITMAARVLEKSQTGAGEVGSRMGQRIQSSSSRMARLIGQVLDASRLQTGLGLQIHLTDVDLSRLLEDLLDEAAIAYPGVRVSRELPKSLTVRADSDRMAQLFTNLVSNARHHGTAGEPVIVQLSNQGDDVVLEVSNSGPPIAPELVPHLFSAFKRQPDSGTRNKSGLGLGLYIAQAIALAHEGTIGYRYADPYVVFSARFPAKLAGV